LACYVIMLRHHVTV